MQQIIVNYWAILVCGVLAMIIGFIWYGPLFGKKWMEIAGVNPADLEARKKMQKSAGPLYAVQFIVTLFQIWVLAYYIAGWKEAAGIVNALWIWAAFVIPTLFGAVMWTNEPGKQKRARFLIQGGYQLVVFIVFGIILQFWK